MNARFPAEDPTHHGRLSCSFLVCCTSNALESQHKRPGQLDLAQIVCLLACMADTAGENHTLGNELVM